MRPIRKGGVRVAPVPKTPKHSTCTQDSSKKHDPVEVFCRLRPLSDPNDIKCVQLYSSTKLGFTPEVMKNRKVMYYSFRHIFTEHAKQREIFDHIAMPLLRGLIKGKNGLLFSYGVTGSGKTHTMSGAPNNPGIVPRCINILFNTVGGCQSPKFLFKSDKLNGFEVRSEHEALNERLNEVKNKRKNSKTTSIETPSYTNDGYRIEDFNDNLMYTIFVTYVEIYNNNAYDLLDDNTSTRSVQAKLVREDSRHNTYVYNCVEVEVKSAKDALALYLLGNQRKRMATTSLNSESSRSHSVFNIRLVISPQNTNEDTDKSLFFISQLSLVDLAGSERCKRTDTTGARLKEAGSINNSLMCLRTCIELLRENQQTGQHKLIPYRDSRLTHLFKSYFEGEGKVNMIVCVNPSIKDLDETIHVMKFAEMTQEVKIARPEAKVGDKQDEPEEEKIDKLIEEIQALRYKILENQGEFPKFTEINPETCQIRNVIDHLKKRKENILLQEKIDQLNARYRARIQELLEKAGQYERMLNDHNERVPALNQKYRLLKNQIKDVKLQMEKANEEIKEKAKQIASLQERINTKDEQLKQSEMETQKHKRKLDLANEKMTYKLDEKLRRQRELYNEKLKDQKEKIEMVKDILSDHPSPPKVPKRSSRTRRSKSEDKNIPEQPVAGPAPKVPKRTSRTRASISESEKEERFSAKKHKVSSPCTSTQHVSETRRNSAELAELIQRRDVPVCNVRYRRSQSTDEKWLRHLPTNPVPMGTIFQPQLNTRKSVSKLTDIKDITNPKQNKYMLMNQIADQEGGIETQLYKGDIIPTATGGAQVILNDVEKLKQESPKKIDSPQPLPGKHNLRRVHSSVIEERCSKTIEHHAPKKPKK